MSIDRKRFQSTSLSSMSEEEENAKSKLPTSKVDFNRPGFLKIEEGRNEFRIAPPINPGEQAYVAVSRVTLECEVPEIDKNGKETGDKELKNKNIFIATVHSKTMKDDPILMYIRQVEKIANETIQDKEERRKFLSPINGWKGRDGKWNWGIKPMSPSYVCYAWDESGELGRLELYQSHFDAIKKLSTERTDEDSPIVVDVFSQLDDAYPLIITKQVVKGKNETSVTIGLPNKKESWEEFHAKYQLSDEQLIELIEKESLYKIYKDAYTKRDFDMAVDGLQRVDEKNGYGVFENEEFLEALSELRDTCPDYTPYNKEEQEEKSSKKNKPERASYQQEDKIKHPAERKPIHTEKEVEEMNIPIPRMKKELRSYINENYGDDYELPELNKQDLDKWYRLMKAGEELPFDSEVEQKEPEPPIKKAETKKVESVPESDIDDDLQRQIAEIRKRRRS